MYLVDTNVVSEMRKGRKANAGVINFFLTTQPVQRYICVQTIGEIRSGIENIRRRGDRSQATRLESWLATTVVEYSGRVLNFDVDCAEIWGRLMSPNNSHPIDKQIAAIALIYGLEVVTRNISDFAATGASLLNPFV